MRIPTYATDGTRRRDYSLAAVLQLEQTGSITAERNGGGEIVAARFQTRERPPNSTLRFGTFYSFEEPVGSYWVWTHRHLLTWRQLEQILGAPVDDPVADVDQFLASVFLAVPLSCRCAFEHSPMVGAAQRVSLGPAKFRERRRQARRTLKQHAQRQKK
jgi:hypothetical protein